MPPAEVANKNERGFREGYFISTEQNHPSGLILEVKGFEFRKGMLAGSRQPQPTFFLSAVRAEPRRIMARTIPSKARSFKQS